MSVILKKNINGYILAGGKSSRMGEDKGLMLLDGLPIIQYVMDALQSEVNQIHIVSNNTAYEVFGVDVINDVIKDIGPAGGIYTALNHSVTDFNFIISCDMPFVTKEAIAYVIQNASDLQIVMPLHDGQLEPLFGVYQKDCKKEWLGLINKGIVKLQEMVTHFDLLKLTSDKEFNSALFANINTREEFEKAIHQKQYEN